MLKLLLSIYLVASFGIFGISQSNTQKVKDYLGDERFEQTQASNPGLISFLEMKAEKGYRFSESIEEKKSSYVQLDQIFFKKEEISIETFIDALNEEGFNLLNYSFPNQDSNVTTHYLIGDSGMLLTIYSNAVINNKITSTH